MTRKIPYIVGEILGSSATLFLNTLYNRLNHINLSENIIYALIGGLIFGAPIGHYLRHKFYPYKEIEEIRDISKEKIDRLHKLYKKR